MSKLAQIQTEEAPVLSQKMNEIAGHWQDDSCGSLIGLPLCNSCQGLIELAISKVDKTGRVYIPGDLREALGIGLNEIVEVNVEGERLILERKKSSVSAKGRGLFKLKRHVEDVDMEIRKGSLRATARELREIRRR
jgi:AbrB family looped-hinge helix DNA binding protein